MKRSNKLLIAFGAALIILPILGMVYSSQVYYTSETEAAKEHRTVESFSQKTIGFTSVAMPSQFNKIDMVGTNGSYILLHLVKDAQSGIKVPEDFKNNIQVNVVDGVLRFKLVNFNKDRNPYINVYVYGPVVNELTVDQVNDFTLETVADSLNVNIKQAENFNLNGLTALNKLVVKAENVGSVVASESKIKSLSLNLANSSFYSKGASYDQLSISTSGNSTVKTDEYNSDKVQTIQSLFIQTVGKAEVTLNDVVIANCAGSFSDETVVQMPAVNINQMYKK